MNTLTDQTNDTGCTKGNNPYRVRVHAFPGRMFTGEEPASETAAIRAVCGVSEGVFVEIGSGSGMHLLEVAQQSPLAAVFGFELRFKRAVRTLEKAQARGIENAYVLRMNGEMLAARFPERNLRGVFVNYPDPWPKTRWHKHRVLSPWLLDTLSERLIPGGFLSVKTDHREYFNEFHKLAALDQRYQIVHLTHDLYASEFLGSNVPTEFEQMFVSQNLPLCYARCELIAV